jgi:hypothetical protein
MNPLVNLLLKSIAGKAFQQAPEGSAFNFMGTQMERYDPISGMYNLLKNAPVIGEKIQGFKSAVAPMPYGTSQKQYNEYQGIVDSSSGLGSFGDLISGIYGEGGVMQGYNPVSAFGRGPVGAIENRISSIMNRTAPMTDFARNQIWSLYDARDQLVGGQGINAVTRPGTYAYDDVTIGGSGTGGDGGSSSSSDNFSSQGFGSEGNTSVSTDFGSFDFSRD